MKRAILRMIINKILCSFVLSIVLVAAASQPLQATVITLTGGDPGEGFTPLPVTYTDAYHFGEEGGAAPYTVQGVTFAPVHSVLFPGPYQFVTNGAPHDFDVSDSAPTFTNSSANDAALANILQATGRYAPMSITLTGLQAGSNYQVDVFAISKNDSRSGAITFNGAQSNPLNEVGGAAYDIREIVTAITGITGGEITIATTNTSNNPFIEAFAVAPVPVPEPSGMALIGVGTLGLLAAARRRRRC